MSMKKLLESGFYVLNCLCFIASGGSIQTPDEQIQQAVNLHGIKEFSIQKLDISREGDKTIIPILLDGQVRRMILSPYSLRGRGFRVCVTDDEGMEYSCPEAETFRGEVEGDSNYKVIARNNGGKLRATVHNPATGKKYRVMPVCDLSDIINDESYVIYTDIELPPGAVTCGVTDIALDMGQIPEPPVDTTEHDMDVRVCEIAVEADYLYFVDRNSDVNEVVADVEMLMNGVSFIYEMDTRVTFEITEIIVHTSEESDPYTTNNPDALLGQFMDNWNDNHTDIPYDIAHLLTGRNLDGSPIGIAYMDSVCYSTGYGLSETTHYTDFDTRVSLTAHEIGHNFNAYHCDDFSSDCRIMCSNITGCSEGYRSFGSSAVTKINSRKTRSCLSDSQVPVQCLELPFFDDFGYASGWVPQPPSAEMWIEVDNAQVKVGKLEIEMGRTYTTSLKLGTLRTRPISITSPAVISYLVKENTIPAGWYLNVEYLDNTFRWNRLEMIKSDGDLSKDWTSHMHSVPADAFGNFFALRFSGFGYYKSYTGRDWFVDDVLIEPLGADLNDDTFVDLEDFAIFAGAWSSVESDSNWNPEIDLSLPPDGSISWEDLMLLADYWMLGK